MCSLGLRREKKNISEATIRCTFKNAGFLKISSCYMHRSPEDVLWADLLLYLSRRFSQKYFERKNDFITKAPNTRCFPASFPDIIHNSRLTQTNQHITWHKIFIYFYVVFTPPSKYVVSDHHFLHIIC